MFMEVKSMKEEMRMVKGKLGITQVNSHNANLNKNDSTGPKMILTGNSGIGIANVMSIRRDERRYGDIPGNSSVGSSHGGFSENLP